ncbi:uncharacterized transporter YutK-like [Littorina saxatilis]|uniref:Uncharacterized protein n=1 Tax=Littorina saxatilis TaxID=31220 RepID=A0AAN9G7N0_9CAEN
MESNHKHNNNNSKDTDPLNTPPDKEKETAILFENHLAPDDDNDSFYDSSDDDDDEKMREAACVNRVVIRLQRGVSRVTNAVNDRFGGHFLAIVCVLLYFAYFIYAMYYRFGDESSIRLLVCTILGVMIAVRHQVCKLVGRTSLARWWKGEKSPAAARRVHTVRFFTKWLLYGGVGAFMAYVIVDVAIKDADKLRSLPGIFVFLLICFLFSSAPAKVNWHTIYWSVGMQFILAVLVMRWQGGKNAVLWVQSRLDEFFANSKPASQLMFGEKYYDHYMIFGALPIVFLTNSALAMLYYLGAMQFLVKAIGNSLRFVLGTSAIESTGVAASIFMEGASAMLALRPYLGKLTHSELFALTSACLSSIGGAFLAILAQLGIPVEFMLPAMVISAPATFAVCKLIAPETRKAKKITFGGELPLDMQYSSILEAAQAGAISVVSLVANVVVVAFAFFALIAWANETCTWFGDRVGIQQLTMEKVLSYLFYPLALLMGVDLDDCRNVAMLMGLRLSSSNFVALLKMAQLVGNRHQFQQYSMIPNATVTYVGDHIILDQLNVTLIEGYISRRSEAIATYALCGFSGILSMFITLGIMTTLVPHRRKWLTSQAFTLLMAGNLANFMVGCFAGMLV